MKLIDVYNSNKERYGKFVIMIKSGNFYEVYGEDAYIMNNLFSYRIKEFGDTKRVGFPLIAYNKVTDKLRAFKINYVIIDNDDVFKKRFNINNYEKYLSKDLSIDDRINKIYDRLRILKRSPKISDVLDKIEEVL